MTLDTKAADAPTDPQADPTDETTGSSPAMAEPVRDPARDTKGLDWFSMLQGRAEPTPGELRRMAFRAAMKKMQCTQDDEVLPTADEIVADATVFEAYLLGAADAVVSAMQAPSATPTG